MNRPIRTLAVITSLLAIQTYGQSEPASKADATTNLPPVVLEAETEKASAFSASVYTYFVPDDDDYAQPTITFDQGWLHLEARYNYEDLETASAWIGYNLGGGEKLTWEFTPMIGGVFGNTKGLAPGYKGSLGWWKLELYSEGEYMFDVEDSSDSFFYNWSELTLAPTDWFRFGLVTQRTRVYETDREIQRGLLVGFSYQHVGLTAYALNPDEGDPIAIVALTLSF